MFSLSYSGRGSSPLFPNKTMKTGNDWDRVWSLGVHLLFSIRTSQPQGLGYLARLWACEFGVHEYRGWATLQGYGPLSSGSASTGVGLPCEARGLRVRVPRVQGLGYLAKLGVYEFVLPCEARGLRVRVPQVQGLGYLARLGVYVFRFREYRGWTTLRG